MKSRLKLSSLPAVNVPNGLIDWTANGGQHLCLSSAVVAPLLPNHRQR